ncbi:MAG: hypothetical protein K9G33_09490 [Sneathiella sp.]|nr:hypothetical protein [Sneathiella sp.]
MTDPDNKTWLKNRTDPQVLSETRDGEVVALELFAPGDLFQFQGHFPGDPILPGVAQLDWVARFAKSRFDLDRGFRKLGQLKFSRLIRADSHLTLTVKLDRGKGRVSFSFSEGGEICSSGFLELAGT